MEKKSITNTAQCLLELWNAGLFSLVWVLFYNGYVFRYKTVSGGLATIAAYLILYNALCSVYKAFRIVSAPVGETLFSQTVAFGVADLAAYAECCLLCHRFVNLLPGAGVAAAQIGGTALILMWSKHYYVTHVPPKRTLLIYGTAVSRQSAADFRRRILEKYGHLFCILELLREEEPEERLKDAIREHDTVLFYEVSVSRRNLLTGLCMTHEKAIYFTPTLADILRQGCSEKHLLDTPLLKYDYAWQGRLPYYFFKRLLDIALSVILLIVALPVMVVTAVAIRREDQGPVFFRQKRCTKGGREFEIIKFRSMREDAEKTGAAMCEENDKRITKVGKIIRASRIDELPQLINILKGDMSFVGPRPERREFIELYSKEIPEFSYRMRVKGGLTGYAQIYGKYNTSAYDKLRLDLVYIENQSLVLDLKILLLTFPIIFRAEATEGFSKETGKLLRQRVNGQRRKGTQAKVVKPDFLAGGNGEPERAVK